MKLTPMMEQYHAIKKDYPDCLLFYRMGDFYEMFADDALVGSKALEITLTGRGAGEEGKVPMCGVPYHAADAYIAKLIQQGFKVAICEQVEDPKTAKGIVKREVIRVITPGTLVDSTLLKEDAANYIAAVFPCTKGFGIAYSDISTGEFYVAQVEGDNALSIIGDELSRISPSECVLPKALYEEEFFFHHVWDRELEVVITKLEDELFIRQNAEALLTTQFRVASLIALGVAHLQGAVYAAAALLYIFNTTQKRELSYINQIQVYNIDQYMIMDSNTRRNLELTAAIRSGRKKGSLYGVCDLTSTALGSRLLKQWIEKPLLNSADINLRLNGIEELIDKTIFHGRLRDELKNIFDLERLIGRVVYGNATPRDLIALKCSFARLPELEVLLSGFGASIFLQLYDQFDILEDLFQLIDESIVDEDTPVSSKDGGVIKDGYQQEIDELRQIQREGKSWLLRFETKEKDVTGIRSLKVGFNKVFGYYIEVTNSNLSLVPDTYIRKQTLTNAERFITQELKTWEDKILGAEERLASLEYEIFNKIREEIAKNTARIQMTARCVAILDCLVALAALAMEQGYSKPLVNDGSVIELVNARHPVVEAVIGRENYVPNSTYLDNEKHQFSLITGPNMSGKSTYMRQVALAVILARMGSYIPAERAVIGKVDKIFTRVGASDDLAAGQSTFMVEMCETSNIIRNATKDSLIILDEIGRGTSTYDGLSIAWAVSEYLLQPSQGAKTLFATHYHELIQLADFYPQVQNYSIAVKESGNTIVFLRQIVSGGTDKSYGIHVAQLAGLPQSIINRANELLHQLEKQHDTSQIAIEAWDTTAAAPALPVADHPVLTELKDLNVSNLRPVEALLYLEKWQQELDSEDK